MQSRDHNNEQPEKSTTKGSSKVKIISSSEDSYESDNTGNDYSIFFYHKNKSRKALTTELWNNF